MGTWHTFGAPGMARHFHSWLWAAYIGLAWFVYIFLNLHTPFTTYRFMSTLTRKQDGRAPLIQLLSKWLPRVRVTGPWGDALPGSVHYGHWGGGVIGNVPVSVLLERFRTRDREASAEFQAWFCVRRHQLQSSECRTHYRPPRKTPWLSGAIPRTNSCLWHLVLRASGGAAFVNKK